MRLNQLRPPRGQKHHPKRVGRGMGSGGRRAGRGDKGQRSRSGYSSRLGFEGGQNPLIRRIPKRGFTNIFKKRYAVVNLETLARLKDVDTVTPELLLERGVVKKLHQGLRVLGDGDCPSKLTVRAHYFSQSARQKIEAAGGKAEVIAGEPRP